MWGHHKKFLFFFAIFALFASMAFQIDHSIFFWTRVLSRQDIFLLDRVNIAFWQFVRFGFALNLSGD